MSITKEDSICPIANTAKLIGDVWILLIIRDLLSGPKRYSDFFRSLSHESTISRVSSKTISHRLKSLEEKGLINRTVFNEKPVRIEYSLTENGRALHKIIHQMSEYGERYLRED